MPSLTIIRPRRRDEIVEYSRVYRHNAGPAGAGFAFDCDYAGNVDTSRLAPTAAANYRACVLGLNDTTDEGVREYRRLYTQPAIGRCACGQAVTLDGDTRGEGIDCDCGRVYNGLGQELAPRSQWDDGRNDY